jgi:hypothetical protein
MTSKAYAVITGFTTQTGGFSDTFSGSSVDSTKWISFVAAAAGGGTCTVAEASDQLEITMPSGNTGSEWGGACSVEAYSLLGGTVTFEVTALGEAMVFGDKTRLGIDITAAPVNSAYDISGGGYFQVLIAEGDLNCLYQDTAGVTYVYSASYDTTNQKWLRLTESAGTVSFQGSPDGTTWTTLATVATSDVAAAVDLSSAYFTLHALQWGSGVGSTVGMSNFTLSSSVPAAIASAIVTSDSADLDVLGTLYGVFSYDATNEDVRQAVVAAVRTAASDSSLDVELL